MNSRGPEALLTNLTWAGHEFADAARDEKRWKKAMAVVREKSGSVTMSVLTQFLTYLMRTAFQQSLHVISLNERISRHEDFQSSCRM
jgi:hypothetical protein